MNRYDYLTQYEKACKKFYTFIHTFIEQHIMDYKQMLKGDISKLWEKKYSQYDGTFFGGIATITIDGSNIMPETIFKYHQMLYGPIISRKLYYKLMKGITVSNFDIMNNIIANNSKDEYDKFRYPKIYKLIGYKTSIFQRLQTRIH